MTITAPLRVPHDKSLPEFRATPTIHNPAHNPHERGRSSRFKSSNRRRRGSRSRTPRSRCAGSRPRAWPRPPRPRRPTTAPRPASSARPAACTAHSEVCPAHSAARTAHTRPSTPRPPRPSRAAARPAAPRPRISLRRARPASSTRCRSPPPLPPELIGHVSSLPPVLTGHDGRARHRLHAAGLLRRRTRARSAVLDRVRGHPPPPSPAFDQAFDQSIDGQPIHRLLDVCFSPRISPSLATAPPHPPPPPDV